MFINLNYKLQYKNMLHKLYTMLNKIYITNQFDYITKNVCLAFNLDKYHNVHCGILLSP